MVADVLQRRGRLKSSSSDGSHWLGEGIYFWEDDPSRALWWARRKRAEAERSNKKWKLPVRITEPAVVGAIIYLGNCLDLTTERDIAAVRKTFDLVRERYGKARRNLPVNQGFWKTLDAYIVDETCREYSTTLDTTVDTIRGVFAAKSGRGFVRAYPGSDLFGEAYRMVCVRNNKNIVDYFSVDTTAGSDASPP